MKNSRTFFVFVIFSLTIYPVLSACDESGKVIAEVDDTIIEEVDPYKDIKEWFSYLCSPELGGRYSGSEGIKKAVVFLSDVIGDSDSLEITTFFAKDTIKMHNLIFHVKGLSDSLFVVGAHYDAFGYLTSSALPGADDNMSGVAVLLGLIKRLQSKEFSPYYSLDICLFDGEEMGRFGSKHYLENCKNGIKMYINVDTCGKNEGGIGIYCDINNPFLKDDFKGVFQGVKTAIVDYRSERYTTDCQYFAYRSIPYVSIMNDSSSDYLHSYNDDVSHIFFERISFISDDLEAYLRTR